MVCIARGLLTACLVTAAAPAPTWLPSDALDAASLDILTVAPEARPHIWYLWLRHPDDPTADAVGYALNAGLSRAPYPIRPIRVQGQRLIRLDLRKWLPDPRHRVNFQRVLAGYVDPAFYVATPGAEVAQGMAILQLTPGVQLTTWPPTVVERKPGGVVHLAIAPFNFQGRVLTRAATTQARLDQALSFRGSPVFGPALAAARPESIRTLVTATGNPVPIVDAERWLVFSMSTLDGGLYYDLQGFRGLNEKQWAALWGADLEATKEATEYVGRWRSEVTGDPRRATFAVGRNIRQSTSYPLVVITQDIADGAFDAQKHPIYSLGEGFKWDASEALAMRSNGFIAAALFDGEGVLQDSAPDVVVNDRTTPAPHSTRLQPIISCIRCHGEHEGWRKFPNDVQTLLGDQRVLAAFDVQTDNADPRAYLAAKYSGDLTLPLQYARDSHQRAVFKVTDGRGAVEVMDQVGKVFNSWQYDQVTPAVAAYELGVDVAGDETAGLAALNELLPPPPPGVLEDPAILSLKMYGEHPELVVDRKTWESQYQATLSRLLRGGGN